jgi:hypothetical protein
MIPVIIEDYTKKLLEKTAHPERRQFYYDTLVKIRDEINNAISNYEKERKFKK